MTMQAVRPQPEGAAATLRRRDGERTRQALLDAAWQIFSERGFADATVDDIVSSCGVSRGTFYTYFQNKTDIFKTLAEEVLEAMGRVTAERPPRELDRWERIRHSNETYLHFFKRHRHILREVIVQAVSNEEFSHLQVRLRDDFVARVQASLERRAGLGQTRDLKPELYAYVLSGMVYWFAFDWLARDSLELDRFGFDDIVDGLTRVWYNAIYPDEGRAAP